MGIGMVMVVAPDAAAALSARLSRAGERFAILGSVRPGRRGVVYDLGLTDAEGGLPVD
jgi:phosphoribosylaminoimidazole (AIR) synthetase